MASPQKKKQKRLLICKTGKVWQTFTLFRMKVMFFKEFTTTNQENKHACEGESMKHLVVAQWESTCFAWNLFQIQL